MELPKPVCRAQRPNPYRDSPIRRSTLLSDKSGQTPTFCREPGFDQLDLLSFGRSERPGDPKLDTSVSAQVDVLNALMTHWDLDRAHLVSHDIGGAIAMRFAIFHPEKVHSLTLIDTVSFNSWPSPTWRERIKIGLSQLEVVYHRVCGLILPRMRYSAESALGSR